MRAGRITVGAALLVLLAACGADEPLTEPPQAQDSASSASPTPSTAPSPSPSPTAPPLSAFEADPAVQGLRTYLLAVATAVNARDLQQPRLLATATAARAALHQDIYGSALEGHYPGPSPVAVLGVEVVSETERSIPVCSPETGFVLTMPGGPPFDELEVLAGRFRMVFESGTWKVDDAVGDDAASCVGVPLQPVIA